MIILLCSYILLQSTVNAEECPKHCQSTSSGNSCCVCDNDLLRQKCRLSCLTSYDACDSCRNSYRKYFELKCIGCHEYENIATEECRPCPDGCVSCFDNTYCFECKSGLYGRSCSKSCGNCKPDNKGVLKCDSDFGTCANGCVDGYFGHHCDKLCRHCKPDNQGVIRCDQFAGTCANGCVDGYFYPKCDTACGHCVPNNVNVVKCDLFTGFCATGCAHGYFGRGCKKKCGYCLPDDKGRVTCDVNTGICLNICMTGYFSQTCEYQCSSNCFDSITKRSRCERLLGNCINGCVSGWYGDTCNQTCSYTCSNRSCSQTTGYCDNGCVQGWYGDTCNETCSVTCANISCSQKTGYCDNGCMSGWYGDTCNETCNIACSERSCSQTTGYCDSGCMSGRYGDTCNKTCSFACYITCSQTLGFCENGCVQGWYGDTCNKICSYTCSERACSQKTGYCDNGCVQGWYGDRCSETCSDTCFNTSCSERTSYCDNKCVYGWYGDKCNETCSDTCSNMSCSQKTGHCDNMCVSGWYGDTCKQSCSHTCYDKSCDQYSGYCDHGCVSGYYGDTCEFSCVDTCKENVCDRETSQCLQGCVTGYEGTFCNITLDAGHDSVLVGFTGSLAGAILSLVLVMILWFIRRIILRGKRYSNLRMSNRESSAPVYDEITDTNGITIEQRLTVSHIYMEVGTAPTQRSVHGSGSNTGVNGDNEIPGIKVNTLFGDGTVVETTNGIPLVPVEASNTHILHSGVCEHKDNDGDGTLIRRLNSPSKCNIYRESLNESRKYYEIPDIKVRSNLKSTDGENLSSDRYETPKSGARITCQNAEFAYPEKSNKISISTTSDSNEFRKTKEMDAGCERNTYRKNLVYFNVKREVNTRVKDETDNKLAINKKQSFEVTEERETIQTLQTPEEINCNKNYPGSDIDIQLQKSQIQNKASERDSESLNYIHPVN